MIRKKEPTVISVQVKNHSVSCPVLLPGTKMPCLQPPSWLKLQPGQKIRKTLFIILKEIYAQYGFSQEKMIYIVRKGLSGAQEIKNKMENFRHNTPTAINGSPVVIKKIMPI